jgi:Ni2+-binding GTPase involved in maturation of urease and hydrogenase
MQPVRFIMIGGFLGAGKTTAIARLARTYLGRGQRVAIITNDHASELVDTHTFRSLGFNVGEIPGACFCGNLDDLTSAVERTGALVPPEVVLVEPVGSCTDMVATVIRPLKRLFAKQFDVAPYGVLLKPSHGAKILRRNGDVLDRGGGFSPQAEYIFRQQLEEADFVAINRIDQLAASHADELEVLIREQYSDVPVLRTSAKTGQGFDEFLELLDQRGEFGNRILALDYERYAAGEADLGWLNTGLLVEGRSPFDLDQLLLGIVTRLHESLGGAALETAHLKVIGQWEGAFGVANLIASHATSELSLPSRQRVPKAHLILNARVAAEPSALEAHVSNALNEVADAMNLAMTDRHTQCFRPGQPMRPPQVSLAAPA